MNQCPECNGTNGGHYNTCTRNPSNKTEAEKVIFLAYDNKNLREETVLLTGCSHCGNKTFLLRPDNEEDAYPVMSCAACGTQIGRIGWVE